MRQTILVFLGGKCVRCPVDDFRVLQIDHVFGGGGKERKKFPDPYLFYRAILSGKLPRWRYQLLCANCNWLKHLVDKDFDRGS